MSGCKEYSISKFTGTKSGAPPQGYPPFPFEEYTPQIQHSPKRKLLPRERNTGENPRESEVIADEAVDQLMRTAPMLLSATWAFKNDAKRSQQRSDAVVDNV